MKDLKLYKWKNNYWKLLDKHNSLINNTNVKSRLNQVSQFSSKSDNFKLPVIVNGRLITSGIYKKTIHGDTVLTPDELKKTMSQWIGKEIYKGHDVWKKVIQGEDVPIDSIIGRITDVRWDEAENGIDYTAAIYDRGIAYKIASDLIKYVSVGFLNDIVWKEDIPHITEVVPGELSLVFNPRDKKASIKVKEINY